ncbi:MAG: 4Fe-4S binding protein [Methanomassiliicoccus sp.]|nr:4Fe-4S binding protein [Methanomassiliicoccus sp.]
MSPDTMFGAMEIKELTDGLLKLSEDLGADLFGIAPAEGFLDDSYRGGRPQAIMSDCRAVVVVGVALLQGSIEPLPQGRGEYTNSLLAATVRLRQISFDLGRWLERRGHQATIEPAEGSEFGYWYADRETLRGGISLRYAAYLAGLGQYGLSQNLITDQYGPRVRFMGIITDADLGPTDRERSLLSEKCKDCRRCVEACPVGALSASGEIDRHRCKEYMFGELGGLRCGMCLKACPVKRPLG